MWASNTECRFCCLSQGPRYGFRHLRCPDVWAAPGFEALSTGLQATACCSWSHGLYAFVAVLPAPVRVPAQRSLAPSVTLVTSIQFLTFTPISLRLILVLSFHLRLGLPRGLFLVGLSLKILKAIVPSSILATFSAHLNLLDLIVLVILGQKAILKPSQFPKLNPFGSKYSPEDPVLK